MKFIQLIAAILLTISLHAQKQSITIVRLPKCSERTSLGVERLQNALIQNGYEVTTSSSVNYKTTSVLVGESSDEILNSAATKAKISFIKNPGKEGFSIKSNGKLTIIRGADASGALYGCLELIDQINASKKLPENIDITDQPEMVMRGACIGMQKTVYLPGHDVYEYPYTPENFPWFYDKALWTKYLDMLLANRMNSLYLWNGHPFASLVKLKDYPYALEVDEQTFKKNEEMFAFLTEEANKRGIYVVQMFYNIIVSKPFADKNGMKTQDRNRPIIPIIADYTRKSIAAFVEKYPNVGLLVCLGEAINTEEDDVKWFTETIIPGVKDGLKALGRTDEPPIILRAHDTNAPLVMEKSLPLYKNLYTMNKYNGESLTTYEPRGPWTETHQKLSKAAPVHIENVHILANLEPFRYASPAFIQKSVQAMHNIHGANGLHVYPQASYWDWPYSADATSPRLLQIDRDWMWYKTWARYAWNSKRSANEESTYWASQLDDFYGCKGFGANITEAYDQTGEIAPKLLRRFGITDGNRQSLLLGMFMSQLVNPYKWGVYQSFYNSNGPKGEILVDWARKEWKKLPHEGETPPQIIAEVTVHGQKAVEAIDKAAPYVTQNKEEFERLRNDVYCYNEFAQYFAEREKAAELVLRFKYSNQVSDLETAIPMLERSLAHYQKLVDLTKDKYLYANSMQTAQRRIPIGGDNGKNKTWAELYPKYREELENFKKNVTIMKTGSGAKAEPIAFEPAQVELLDSSAKWYSLSKGQKIYTDNDSVIKNVAIEIQKLKGISFNSSIQINKGTQIRFKNTKPVKVLVGYFNGQSRRLMQPPSLETNASANDRGQADIRIANAMFVPGLFPVNVYSYYFDVGENTLDLGKGMVLILGFIDGSQKINMRDAGFSGTAENDGIDWLFY